MLETSDKNENVEQLFYFQKM